MARSKYGQKDGGPERKRWKQDPEGVRSDILRTALEEFSANGLSGGRIDEIAAKTRTSKRMIYYYFGDKAGLYRKVLEEAYSSVRAGEKELHLELLNPVEALQKLIEFTFDHHLQHRNFVRLVMIENLHNGTSLEQSDVIRTLNQPIITQLQEIYDEGVAEGYFRAGITPLELHWQLSALSFFNVSNRTTFSLIFGDSLTTPQGQAVLREHVVKMLLRFVLRSEWVERYT